jgi:hypothetical protein
MTTRIISEYNNNGNNRWWLLVSFAYGAYHIFDVDANLSRIDGNPTNVKFGFAGAYNNPVSSQISRSENNGIVGNGYFQAWYNSTTATIDVWLYAASFSAAFLNMRYYNVSAANVLANWTTTGPVASASYTKQWDTSVNAIYTSLSNGNVGINTPTPTAPLNVNGPGSYSAATANPQTGQLVINTTNGTERLILGSYYTGGIGSICAIQSSDFYNSLDHGQSLLLNPLGGNVNMGGGASVAGVLSLPAQPSWSYYISNYSINTSQGIVNPFSASSTAYVTIRGVSWGPTGTLIIPGTAGRYQLTVTGQVTGNGKVSLFMTNTGPVGSTDTVIWNGTASSTTVTITVLYDFTGTATNANYVSPTLVANSGTFTVNWMTFTGQMIG